jgi:hypothetical protein
MAALRIVATVDGAMLVAHSLGDLDVFENVVAGLSETLLTAAALPR